jgi:hypothetical protein
MSSPKPTAFSTPSQQELDAYVAKAQAMRAQTIRALFAAAWRALTGAAAVKPAPVNA